MSAIGALKATREADEFGPCDLSEHGLEVCILFPSAVTYFEINSG